MIVLVFTFSASEVTTWWTKPNTAAGPAQSPPFAAMLPDDRCVLENNTACHIRRSRRHATQCPSILWDSRNHDPIGRLCNAPEQATPQRTRRLCTDGLVTLVVRDTLMYLKFLFFVHCYVHRYMLN